MSSNTIKVVMVLSQFWIDCTDYESCKLNWNCIEMKGEKVMLIHKLNKYILKVIDKVHLFNLLLFLKWLLWILKIYMYKKSKFFHIHVSQRDIFDWH